MKNKSIEILKGILVMVGYFILPSIILIPFSISIKNKELQYIAMYITVTLFFYYIYRKDINKNIKDFKISMLKKPIIYWLIGLSIMLICSFIYHLIGIDEAINQTNNLKVLKEYPITEITSAIIFTPIIEELVFRKSLYNAIDNKHIYAILTGLIFGTLHTVISLSTIYELLYIIPYSACGIAFGYAYKETDNICPTIIIHSLHNMISLLLLII